jgi:hypothetical protein
MRATTHWKEEEDKAEGRYRDWMSAYTVEGPSGAEAFHIETHLV